jgi:hypothetical protein
MHSKMHPPESLLLHICHSKSLIRTITQTDPTHRICRLPLSAIKTGAVFPITAHCFASRTHASKPHRWLTCPTSFGILFLPFLVVILPFSFLLFQLGTRVNLSSASSSLRKNSGSGKILTRPVKIRSSLRIRPIFDGPSKKTTKNFKFQFFVVFLARPIFLAWPVFFRRLELFPCSYIQGTAWVL